MKKIRSLLITRLEALYLFAVLLYAFLALWMIHIKGGISQATLEGNQFTIDENVKLYWGMLFGPVFVFLTVPVLIRILTHVKKTDVLERFLLLWLGVDGFAFIIGCCLHNPLRYILSDTFVYALFPLAYLYARYSLTDISACRRFFYFVLWIQFIIVTFPIHWGTPAPLPNMFAVGFSTFSGTEAFVTISLFILTFLTKKRVIFFGLLIISIESALMRQRMTYFLQVLLALLLFILVNRGDKRLIKNFFVVSILFSFFIAILNFSTLSSLAVYQRTSYFFKTEAYNIVRSFDSFFQDPQKISQLSHVASRENIRTKESSTDQRIFEIRKISEQFAKKPLQMFFGFGNGATVDFSETQDRTMVAVYKERISRVHSIHFLPLAIMYRQGLLGVVAFVMLCYAIISIFVERRRTLIPSLDTSHIADILFFYFIAMLIGSLFSSPHIFTNITVSFGLGAMMTILFCQQQSKTNGLSNV